MQRREIPGYYYDAEKNKYFKVEKTQTAPSSAAWSNEAVKRRKTQQHANDAAREHAHRLRNHVKRHPLSRDAVAGGLLDSEVEGLAGDASAAAWVRGVVDMGHVPFVPDVGAWNGRNIPCLYVDGQDTKTGMGVAYTTLDGERLTGNYIPMDKNGRIQFSPDATLAFPRAESVRCPVISSMTYHQPSQRMILTANDMDTCQFVFFTPTLSRGDEDSPLWLLGDGNQSQHIEFGNLLSRDWSFRKAVPAPPSSNLICAVATNTGVLLVHQNEDISWMPPGPRPSSLQSTTIVPWDVFDVDFKVDNHNVLIAGGRRARLWATDLRAPNRAWLSARTAGMTTHVRSVNPHQVLVAGLENHMALYDLRFLSGAFARGKRGEGPARPLLTFPGYRNAAHTTLGWDVSPELGVVAAAHDDGTIKLFSLRSGRVLRGEARAGAGPAAGGGSRSVGRTGNEYPKPLDEMRAASPISAMMFQRMPRERLPSLFVGEGPTVRKFSFGSAADDEG